ncbi:MAG TPA: hypothetical protein DEB73_01340 [Candidatus Magasanikbacteria bacterium]|nr:hypothetical protein [Candidatus Magasanikbacteria bacterium]HBX16493.1 hypothetical protein [Candidatus Magasanikbacteria bacterium]
MRGVKKKSPCWFQHGQGGIAYSCLNATTGSSWAARRAGVSPKIRPTLAEKITAIKIPEYDKENGKSNPCELATNEIKYDKEMPTTMPMAPATKVIIIASNKNCQKISFSRAPTALRKPIS